MKKLLIAITLFLTIACYPQPNTSTTIEVGVVNPQPNKTYRVFLEVKEDSTNSRLVDGMDYLDPDVFDLLVTLTNQHTAGDTLFGEITYPDITYTRYVKGGLVQVDSFTQKYSSMKTSYWTYLDSIEPNAAGFFVRRK